jgi:hypothetical protein
MRNSVNVKKILTLTIATLLAIRTVLIVRSSTTLAQSKLNEADFKIKGSGSRMETHVDCRGRLEDLNHKMQIKYTHMPL